MTVLRALARFAIVTLVTMALGLIVGVAGAALGGQSGPTSALLVFGALLMLLSPLAAVADLLWRRSRIATQKRFQATEANQKDLLRRRFIERERLIDAVDRHRGALLRNLSRAIKKNDYGVVTSDDTTAAVVEFLASIDIDLHAISYEEAERLIFEQINYIRADESRSGFNPDQMPNNGHELEHWVAQSLIGFGWSAHVTRGSGDQGIDVIAEREGKKLGLQCKLYATPIGNKAVQEAHAGKIYYNLDRAAVLTNSTFTPSAKDLAAATGILLVTHHDIPRLFEHAFASQN